MFVSFEVPLADGLGSAKKAEGGDARCEVFFCGAVVQTTHCRNGVDLVLTFAVKDESEIEIPLRLSEEVP